MPMEPCLCPSSTTAKKRWKTVRIVFSILQKGITKSKLFLDDLYMVSKQDSNKLMIPWKGLNNLNMCHPTTSPACGSHDVQESFISPHHYEFSCTSSPPYASKRRSRRRDTKLYRNRVSKGYARFHAQPMFMYDMVAPGNVDAVDDVHWNVDMAAEEFIDKFYKELMLQKMNCYSRS